MEDSNNTSSTKNTVLNNLRHGTIEMILLNLLQKEEMYGYQISQDLRKLSNDTYTLNEATLYPTLYRLTRKGYLEQKRMNVIGDRFRVYYHITEKGKEYLECSKQQYVLFKDSFEALMYALNGTTL